MSPPVFTEADFEIQPSAYAWTLKAMRVLERILKVRIALHHDADLLETGDVFLFNHFARFETFIPQYLIHQRTGAYCRSVAAPEFFDEDDPLARYLRSLGAVPTDWPDLLPFLAAEVVRGRKVVVFPEGGMVKDRRVLDPSGEYRVYSRSAHERRKHHTGAAVTALAVEGFKQAVRRAADRGDRERLEGWAADLALDSADELVERARRPTRIVPANITFYPIRITENVLRKGAEWFNRGLGPRLAEELLIEGNILLKNTDMDIRLGDPIDVREFLGRTDRWVMDRAAMRLGGVGAWLAPPAPGDPWPVRWWRRRARRVAYRLRDAYMASMYAAVTVNLSHLASQMVFRLLDRGETGIGTEPLHRALYLAVKDVQGRQGVFLHRSLLDPAAYQDLADGRASPGLEQFLATARRADLVAEEDGRYRFLDELRREHGFDEIRIENPVAVYANEVAPLAAVGTAVRGALERVREPPDPSLWAGLRFDDEVRGYRCDRNRFQGGRYDEVNREETFTESAEPFLLVPDEPAPLGVVVVHGFTAAPAEVRGLGERLRELGYPVCGPRLAGHGTSPWDLRERDWEEWLASVRRAYGIVGGFARRVAVVGFSAGGALGLLLAAEHPRGLAGVAAVAPPVRIRDRSLALVPLVYGANRVVGAVSGLEGIKVFHRTEPEHPRINYRNMPIRALHELLGMVRALERRAPDVRCPVLLVQGTDDPTVDPAGVEQLYRALGSGRRDLAWIPSDRHGLVYEAVGDTWPRIEAFLGGLRDGAA